VSQVVSLARLEDGRVAAVRQGQDDAFELSAALVGVDQALRQGMSTDGMTRAREQRVGAYAQAGALVIVSAFGTGQFEGVS
jgi:hypothetical protein